MKEQNRIALGAGILALVATFALAQNAPRHPSPATANTVPVGNGTNWRSARVQTCQQDPGQMNFTYLQWDAGSRGGFSCGEASDGGGMGPVEGPAGLMPHPVKQRWVAAMHAENNGGYSSEGLVSLDAGLAQGVPNIVAAGTGVVVAVQNPSSFNGYTMTSYLDPSAQDSAARINLPNLISSPRNFSYTVRVGFTALSNVNIWLGVTDGDMTDGVAPYTDPSVSLNRRYIAFRYRNGTDTNWQLCGSPTTLGAAQICVNTGIPVAVGVWLLEIRYSGNYNSEPGVVAQAYIQGVLAGSLTSGAVAPTLSGLQARIDFKSLGGAAAAFTLNGMALEYQ